MLIIECAKFILKTSESQLTVEAMTCEAIRTNFILIKHQQTAKIYK